MFSTVEASRLFFYLCVFDSFSSFFSLSLSRIRLAQLAVF